MTTITPIALNTAQTSAPRSGGRGMVTTGVPAPGRAGGGARGGTGSIAASGVHGRDSIPSLSAFIGSAP